MSAAPATFRLAPLLALRARWQDSARRDLASKAAAWRAAEEASRGAVAALLEWTRAPAPAWSLASELVATASRREAARTRAARARSAACDALNELETARRAYEQASRDRDALERALGRWRNRRRRALDAAEERELERAVRVSWRRSV